jgi:Ca2+-binding EF-hand superfamily protein|uniref:EF-hand domain-containing protein n=1 Tax=Eutreptiella gymnastica TaxID=73025 RepID=A0A7S4C9W1_9EUGL|eukprot:CAMPEP_0174294404 /NCGR_PEP_ID=MMETSP0809-20121228/41547_1 /TAXON_ID=73025 ORGANISM="Eutreptiella gymnastica-like, Strain CCMP1594" /NCGR_SAMPLE_ID=MMETSP0809 /ASSEMBLY_ACC=CAM_ASM_000658 /LENGTH=189 /DNA_ID=CAMNT_0015395833 /DNA_START=128 /DNA_END=697 /DNA_ORIENTATION=+
MGKNISKEKMEEYKKTIKGKFDEKEIKHMYKLFHKAAPTGKMGKKEFKKYIEDLAIFKKVDSQESYDQLFRGYDRDADGTITFKEYLEYHLGIVFSEPDELFDIVFSMYDADGNGYITRDELIEVVTNSTRWMGDCDVESKDVQDLIQAEVDKIVIFADVNKDGQISKEELYAAYEKHPEILEKLKNLA